MSASNFNLRGISSEVMNLLKQEAKKLQVSVNILILNMIEQGLGVTHRRRRYQDLDHLAGTWSKADQREFEKNTKHFEQIDKEMW